MRTRIIVLGSADVTRMTPPVTILTANKNRLIAFQSEQLAFRSVLVTLSYLAGPPTSYKGGWNFLYVKWN